MTLRLRIINRLLKALWVLQSLGKAAEYVYVRGGASFTVRRNTSDRFVVDEVWGGTYPVRIDENATVIDAGANIGAFTVYAAKQATNGKVIALEPEPRNRAQLERNVRMNDLNNVTVLDTGLAGDRGSFRLFLGKANKGTGSIYSSESDRSIEITCRTLADVIADHAIDRVNLLKVDIEGAEYDVILNMPDDVLAKIDHIVLEYHESLGLNHTGAELAAHLTGKGFTVRCTSSWLYRKMLQVGVLHAQR